MSGTFTSQRNLSFPGVTLVSTNSVVTEMSSSLDVSIPDSSTDLLVNFVADFDDMKALGIQATGGDLLVETNNGTTPDDTINLVDGVAQGFIEGDGTNPITQDITALYVTNSSGAAVRLQLVVGIDPTP